MKKQYRITGFSHGPNIDYPRIVNTYQRGNYSTVGYETGWLEFFEAGKLDGSVKTSQNFFEGLSIDWFNGQFTPNKEEKHG